MWRSQQRRLGRKKSREYELITRAGRCWALIFSVILLLCAAATAYVIFHLVRETASDDLPTIALKDGQDFAYPLNRLGPAQTRIFAYPIGPRWIRFLVHRDSNGALQSATLSCTTCYAYRQKSHLNRGQLICGRCQDAMHLPGPNQRVSMQNGCVPFAVPFSVDKGMVVIRSETMRQEAERLLQATGENQNAKPASTDAGSQITNE
ncbi:MAG: Fe-S-containing protein [Actinomycetota bacterium]